MTIIGQRFYANSAPVSVNTLVDSLHLPQQSIEQQLDLLVEHGLLVNIDQDELTYTPARPLEELTLKSVVDTVREPGPSSHFKNTLSTNSTAIQSVLRKVDDSLGQVLGSKTVKDIVNELDMPNDKIVNNAVTPISKVDKS
jgi:DNA-binding IscR family transcriptional regulator